MVSISLKVAVGNHSATFRLHFLTFESSVEQEMTLQELLKNDAASRTPWRRVHRGVRAALIADTRPSSRAWDASAWRFPQPLLTFDLSLESTNLCDTGLVS